MARFLVALPLAAALCSAAAPATAAPPGVRATASVKVHVVYPGQTLAMIAKRYQVSVDALCKANGITRRSPIRPKQRLVVPGADALIPAGLVQVKAADGSEEHATVGVKGRSGGAKPTDPFSRKPRRKGWISLQSYTGTWQGIAVTKDGKLTEPARKAFERVLASWRTGDKERINGRLVRLLVKVSDHFGGRPLRIVSGYRPYTPTQHTPHSRHNLGHAVDFSVPGVPNSALRDYCRTLSSVGVGYYPNSSFVHLDVREIPTYWVDYSGPGEPPRYAGADGKDPGRSAGSVDDHDGPSGSASDGSGAGSTPDTATFEPDEI